MKKNSKPGSLRPDAWSLDWLLELYLARRNPTLTHCYSRLLTGVGPHSQVSVLTGHGQQFIGASIRPVWSLQQSGNGNLWIHVQQQQRQASTFKRFSTLRLVSMYSAHSGILSHGPRTTTTLHSFGISAMLLQPHFTLHWRVRCSIFSATI